MCHSSCSANQLLAYHANTNDRRVGKSALRTGLASSLNARVLAAATSIERHEARHPAAGINEYLECSAPAGNALSSFQSHRAIACVYCFPRRCWWVCAGCAARRPRNIRSGRFTQREGLRCALSPWRSVQEEECAGLLEEAHIHSRTTIEIGDAGHGLDMIFLAAPSSAGWCGLLYRLMRMVWRSGLQVTWSLNRHGH